MGGAVVEECEVAKFRRVDVILRPAPRDDAGVRRENHVAEPPPNIDVFDHGHRSNCFANVLDPVLVKDGVADHVMIASPGRHESDEGQRDLRD